MNFIKSSILYNFLYSPVSWLHKQKSLLKIFLILTHLLFLPFFQTRLIFLYIFFCLLIYQSINLPIEFYLYFYKIILLFTFFITISLESKKKVNTYLELNRKYLKISTFITTCDNTSKELEQSLLITNQYYSPIALIRLISLHFLSLIFMKLLLLTTSYKKILQLFFYYYKNYINNQLIFEIQIAIQFLKIILEQITIIKVGYTIRSLNLRKRLYDLEIFRIYLLCIKQIIININIKIYSISDTLYNSKIYKKKINFFL